MADIAKQPLKFLSKLSGVPLFTVILGVFFFLVANPVMYAYVSQLLEMINLPNDWMSEKGTPLGNTVFAPSQLAVLLHTVVFLLLLGAAASGKVALSKK